MAALYRLVTYALLTALVAFVLANLPDLGIGEALDDLVGMATTAQLRENLEARDSKTLALMRAKEETAVALLDGRLTLLGAAVRTRTLLDAAEPWFWERFRWGQQGADDDEKLCRHVVGYVRDVSTGRGTEAEAAADRLEEELNERRCLGTLVLPPR